MNTRVTSILLLLVSACATATAPAPATTEAATTPDPMPPALVRGEKTAIQATEWVCHTAPDFPYMALRCGEHVLLESCSPRWNELCEEQGGTVERCEDGCPGVKTARRPGKSFQAREAARAE